MNCSNPVPIERHFSPIPQSRNDLDEPQNLYGFGYQDSKSWTEIDQRYRTVILAEAGAGKTHEMLNRAKFIKNNGCLAFFVRIEDIDDNFNLSLEVGDEAGFKQWISTTEEAWFFLDSVDEARLSDPRDFEKAIRFFADAINKGRHRAHVCISSRPYAWRPESDSDLIKRYLPFEKPDKKTVGCQEDSDDESVLCESGLEIFQLNPLDENDIRLFAKHRSVMDIDSLIEEIERLNIKSLAERPFDLEGILKKWADDRRLGSRSELLNLNIDRRINETRAC